MAGLGGGAAAGAGGAGAGGGGLLSGLGALGAGNGILAIGAGLVIGVAGSTALLATNAVHFGGPPGGPAVNAGTLDLVPCPATGPVIGHVKKGERVLLTGRTSDGSWLEVFFPAPAQNLTRAWTRAGPLQPQDDVSKLPVVDACAPPPTPSPRPTPETAVIPAATPSPLATPPEPPSPSPSPSASPSEPPTPAPTPNPTPTPTATPNAPPTAGSIGLSTRVVNFDQGAYCASAPKRVTFTIAARDADGIASAMLFWRRPGAGSFSSRPMTRVAGTDASGTWQAVSDSTTDALRSNGSLAYYVVVRDAKGVGRRVPAGAVNSMAVHVCPNPGPKIAPVQIGPTTIVAEAPNMSCGNGITLTTFRMRATDSDGVASLTLFFRKPGAGSYVARKMTLDGDWYSYVNTAPSVDNITRPGTISWYIVAKDKKGASSRYPASGTRGIKVIRCDSPATFGKIYTQTGRASISPPQSFDVQTDQYSDDPDGVRSVTLNWTIYNDAGAALVSGNASMGRRAGAAGWFVTLTPNARWKVGFMRWHVTLVDLYGHAYRSPGEQGGTTIY